MPGSQGLSLLEDPYRPETVWYKIKSRTYTQGEGRWELFERK
jgi:hypothetical protein